MKIFNIVKKIILILSFVFGIFSFIYSSFTLDGFDQNVSTLLITFVVLACVGFFLFFTENKIAKKIGQGMVTGYMAILLFCSIIYIDKSVAAIFGLTSVILYAIYFLVCLIGYLALGGDGDNNPNNDIRIKKILGWKELQNQGIITAEEFEAKREEILYGKKIKK